MTATISIPAYAPHETITLTAPTEWHKRIAALSPRCLYGPRFSRPLVDSWPLADLSGVQLRASLRRGSLRCDFPPGALRRNIPQRRLPRRVNGRERGRSPMEAPT